MKYLSLVAVFALLLNIGLAGNVLAHCGSCGVGDDHAEKKACPVGCTMPCCAGGEEGAEAAGEMADEAHDHMGHDHE